jgi:hypothetical protein
VPYDASAKANVRIQFVATKAVKGKAPARKVYEPRACSGALGGTAAIASAPGGGSGIYEGRYPVEQSKLLCSSEFDAAVLFGKSHGEG